MEIHNENKMVSRFSFTFMLWDPIFPSVYFDFINFVDRIDFFLGFFIDEDDKLQRENETRGKMRDWLPDLNKYSWIKHIILREPHGLHS